MVTINYKTSDYITLAFKDYCYSDFENDSEFVDYAREQVEKYGGKIYDIICNEIASCEESDYNNIKWYLENKYDFYFYHVTLEPGYYEGSQLLIENNFSIAYNDYTEKRQAKKELKQIRQFLIDCAGCGMVSCSPGWCTGYSDYTETLKDIEKAICAMDNEIDITPTWYQYENNLPIRKNGKIIAV